MEQHDVAVEVGRRLVRFRSEAGLTVEEAAARTALAADRLIDAESGTQVLDEAEIARLASAYGVDVTEIFGGRVTPLQNYAGY
jgi:transcriptional regulator with XRE-family HTH domain